MHGTLCDAQTCSPPGAIGDRDEQVANELLIGLAFGLHVAEIALDDPGAAGGEVEQRQVEVSHGVPFVPELSVSGR